MGYELRDSFAISVTDICDDIELETHLQLIHEEIFAPKSATNWWCKTRKTFPPSLLIQFKFNWFYLRDYSFRICMEISFCNDFLVVFQFSEVPE